MADFLEFTVVTFTADQLAIKVKNISGTLLDQRLVIELSPPAYLVDDKINDAAIEAANSRQPPGAKSLAGIVTGPEGWSVWVRREASDSSVMIVFINDMNQNGGNLSTPVKFPAGNEFTVRIPLDPGADRDLIDVLYSYKHGKDEREPYSRGKFELKSEKSDWVPDVTLTTDHQSPTMVKAGDPAKIFWHIKDGVSATLRGPLPGGNSELTLDPDPHADFRISDGAVDVRVMGAMTYVLQAEVKRPGKPNVQVVRMLWLDTPNQKYTHVYIHPDKVLPHGLLEINWAAWGVKEVELMVSNDKGIHTSRTVPLTQQTKGRFYEGSGIMRVSATKTAKETVDLLAPPIKKETASVSLVSWAQMIKPNISGRPVAMVMLNKKLGLLTTDALYIAEVGEFDPESPMQKLPFIKVSKDTPRQWLSLTAADGRFVALRRTNQDDLEVAPYKINGDPDEIPPQTLPATVRPLVTREGTVFDCVALGGRVYVVAETALGMRRAFSVHFNSSTRKAEYRSEPLLESLSGYRLVSFDDALYALNRSSGRMFRFGLTDIGMLVNPKQAASAIRENENGTKESMIREGLFVPVGRVLVVLGPSSVPTLKALEPFGLHNVLSYLTTTAVPDPNSIPQDLFYNPQKNYWGRCGHDLDVKPGAVAAFRPTGSRRLWVVQPDGATHTLAAVSETLFAHDYVSDVLSAPLPPYLSKTRTFRVYNASGMDYVPLSETSGITSFSATGPAQFISGPDGLKRGVSETFLFRYNEADPPSLQLRFLADRAAGAKNQYVLEITFVGPDLAIATYVHKRIEGNSLVEVPGTMWKHKTEIQVILSVPTPIFDFGRWKVD